MMEPNKDWLERLDKAQTNEDFINLLNEIPLSQSISLTGEVFQESSSTVRLIPLPLSTSITPTD
jgi:hypothetical protein